jgi:hypothetical protein
MSVLQSRIVDAAMAPLLWGLVAGFGWIQVVTGKLLHPALLTLVALVTSLWALRRIRPLRAALKQLRMGRDGERVVGQMLEALRSKGYCVFHDIPGDGFNLDHVIIGPAGIFTIETKVRSKPVAGRPEIVYDGNTVRLQHAVPDERPLIQARAQASWLSRLLSDARPRHMKVRPVVVFQNGMWSALGRRVKMTSGSSTPRCWRAFPIMNRLSSLPRRSRWQPPV